MFSDGPGAAGSETRNRGNPLESARTPLVCAALVFVVALAVYIATLAPTVTFVDSGELIVAAKYLGVAHPPGTPLYVLLAHMFTLAPLGNIALRVNFASALFAALAAAMMSLLVIEVLRTMNLTATAEQGKHQRSPSRLNKKPGKKARLEPHPGPATAKQLVVAFTPALVAGLLLAFSRTLWSFATLAEVYTLNALLIIVIFLLIFRWRRLRETRLLYFAAFIFGLALGVHHATVGVTLPALAVVAFRTEGLRLFKSKQLLYAALISFAALVLIYTYLPLAAARSPIINWGDPRTLQRIWWHVSGRQYQVFMSFSPEQMIDQGAAFARLAADEFGPRWMPLCLLLPFAGLVDSFRRDRTVFYFLLLIVIANLAYALNYEIAEDKGAYYLPTFLAVAMAAGLGARWVILYAAGKYKHTSSFALLAILIALLTPVFAFAGNFAVNDRHQYFLASDYIHNIESTIAPNGMLLTGDWQVYSPLFYLREVEGQRRDIIAIDINMLRRSWYFDYLETQYPELMKQNRAEVSAFLEELRAWENDPARYQQNKNMTERINSRFNQMIQAFITSHSESAAVYLTLDVAFDTGQDAELARSISSRYRLVPQGLVFQLTQDKRFVQLSETQLVTRGLNDETVRFEPDDVVALKVLPAYLNMLYNRGIYLAGHGRYEAAVRSYKQGLALDPNNAPIRQALADSETALRNAR